MSFKFGYKIFLISLFVTGIFLFCSNKYILADTVTSTGNVNITANISQTVTTTPTTTQPGTGGGGVIIPNPQPFSIFDIVIKEITETSVTIAWRTDQLATSEIYYGETSAYELGVKQGISFLFDHQIVLTNLKPRTTYHFLISSRGLTGSSATAGDFTFTTLPLPDTQPPLAINNFQIFAGDSKLTLTWQNPPDKDLAGVKIYRHLKKYPTNLNGEMIWSGPASSYTDRNLVNGVRYYYTIYAYDYSGNISSGLSNSGIPKSKSITPPGPVIVPPEVVGSVSELLPAWVFQYFINLDLPAQLDEQGSLEVLAYDQLRIKIAKNILPKPVDRAMIRITDTKSKASWLHPFAATSNDDSWLVDLTAPDQGGNYQVTIDLFFVDGSINRTQFNLKVQPFGKVKNIWLPQKMIKGAVVLLYSWNEAEKDWELVKTTNEWQANPQVTGKMGQYGFSVPNGKYYLIAHKEGYWTKVIDPFKVKNYRINFDLYLWPIIPYWWLLLLLLVFGLWQFARKRQYRKILKEIERKDENDLEKIEKKEK